VTKARKFVKHGDLEKEISLKIQAEKKKASPVPSPSSPIPSDKHSELSNSSNSVESNKDADKVVPIPLDMVIQRLRERGEPITLFGESDWQRFQRLHLLEERTPVEYVQGMDNEFGKEIKDLDENLFKDTKKEDDDIFNANTNGGGESEKNKDNAHKEEFILNLFKKLLSEWEQELNDRPEAEKRTAQGKVATATYKQCRKHIKPLFKIMKDKSCPRDIMDSIYEICHFIQDREYVKANDTYLSMAIGNSPWPMGVTMVGIHERSAREKIFTHQVAHVLNDETQRKYIQSIKRIMTWAQHKYPNNPSKCVG